MYILKIKWKKKRKNGKDNERGNLHKEIGTWIAILEGGKNLGT